MLRHVNRPNALFETTDCGLTQTLYRSKNSAFPVKSGWVGWRLMLMYRRLDQNCQPKAVARLIQQLRAGIRRAGRRDTHIGFIIGPFPTLFCATGQGGFQIDIEFAMWGDSFEEGCIVFPMSSASWSKQLTNVKRRSLHPKLISPINGDVGRDQTRLLGNGEAVRAASRCQRQPSTRGSRNGWLGFLRIHVGHCPPNSRLSCRISSLQTPRGILAGGEH